MKIKIYILVILATTLFVVNAAAKPATDPGHAKEHQIKAAFLYNFLNFVDWPAEKTNDVNKPIIIGIVDSEDFNTAFEPIKDKTFNGRKIAIKTFNSLTAETLKNKNNPEWPKISEEMKQCHIIFFYEYQSKNTLTTIFSELTTAGTLTVGQSDNFLESGGNINFLLIDQKVRFEINLSSAKQNNLKIRSNLLKLAYRVIDEK